MEELLTYILAHDECEWIEYKKDKFDIETIGKAISGLSNAIAISGKDEAYMVYGIEDSTKKIIGTNFNPLKKEKGNEEIQQSLINFLFPKVDFEFIQIEKDEKRVIIIKIEAAKNTPVSFKKVQYIRIGSSTRLLVDFPEKSSKIHSKKSTTVFEREIAISKIDDDTVLDLLDYPKLFELLRVRLPSNKNAIIEKLLECKFIIKDKLKYSITNLGAIMLAKDLKKFDNLKKKAVRVIKYEGNSKLITKQEQVGKRGYANGFEGLIEYIETLLPNNEIVEKVFRTEVKMYPNIVIRELVANALIHQDFLVKGMAPMIEIYDNRIEIINPGIPLIETDRLIDHTPQSRNEELVSMMKNMYICEERGSGIDKVIYNVEAFQLPAPKFVTDSSSFKVIIYSYKDFEAMTKEDRIRACYQHSVLKYISGEELMSNSTLRERFQIEHHPTISKIIKETLGENLIKVNDENASNKYKKYIPYWG